ncbi:F-box/LRR-repeat protein 7 [Galendromus occidentalis]|uniref:F-box/LRR-repeat protein 7 n=1 Tax=Galendromus occidentalis TaxID=34638 RepID=A0AAJ7SG95_9ACAR|nr:F-box/LRR-repeat protein 7 [Galendromus occidentalis]
MDIPSIKDIVFLHNLHKRKSLNEIEFVDFIPHRDPMRDTINTIIERKNFDLHLDAIHADELTSQSTRKHPQTTIDKLPEKVLLNIFQYLPSREVGRLAKVCRKWRQVSCDPRLWSQVSLRPEISGLHIKNVETLLQLISVRFSTSLRYIELPIELITHTVLHELSYKCPNLTHMLLDFSTAMQLHDFNDLNAFPTKLQVMCICLSEVIFMEGFMRKIYNFINSLEVLHLIGTYEKVEEEEEEIYEVINIHKLKSAVPNLRCVNMYGIAFVDDSHVEAFSSNCIQLETMAVPYCNKVVGTTLKILFSRCKKLKTLIAPHTGLKSENFMAVDWEATNLQEVDVSATDLSTECLIDLVTRCTNLRYLAAGQQDGFNDLVLNSMIEKGTYKNLIALDLDRNENISEEMLTKIVRLIGPQLQGLVLSGIPHLCEGFWSQTIPIIRKIKVLVMGMPTGCCKKISAKIHVDGILDNLANNCPDLRRLEIGWDSETLRFSDKSSKAIDTIRVKCLRLRCLVLSDGKYFELVKSNFDRADRLTLVRSATSCRINLFYLLSSYKDMIFN